MSERKLTVQDIILFQKQLEAAEQLNNLLGEAVTEIGEAVSGIDIAAVDDQNAVDVLNKVKTVLTKLEKQVEEFTKSLK
ncbi:MAG: hypothetical protein LJE89_11345 [Deltaproteobacteria bacterium]|nr:hypothetical protein [Deltaproteobacteria bacterium]